MAESRGPDHPRTEFLPFARPDIGPREIAAVVEVLESGWLTSGPRVKDFEAAMKARLGVAEAVACSSGTAALHLAVEAAGLGPGDEVIVPTFTFTATAEVVRYVGATPVLVDIDAADLNISVGAASAAVGPRTRAIIAADIGGFPCDWTGLRRLAQVHDLVLIDDAAHALPATLEGVSVGHWADMTALSFYATKTLTTGEGGMLLTDRAAWADRARVMRLHGIAQDAWNRYGEHGTWYYEVVAPGFKYNLTDIAAAMGLVQLERLDETTARRTQIAAMYTTGLASVAGLSLPGATRADSGSWHLYTLRLAPGTDAAGREEFLGRLKAARIGTSVHFIPLHRHPYYHEDLGFRREDFPVAEREFERVVSLPIYPSMSDRDVADVIAAVTWAAE